MFDTTVETAYDCCVAAVTFNGPDTSPDTSVFGFDPSIKHKKDNCFIGTTGDTCPNPASNPSTAITGPDGDLVVGNSYCGEINAAVAEFFPSSSLPVRRSIPTSL